MSTLLGYEERYCERCGGVTEGAVREDSMPSGVVGWFCSQCGYADEA